MTNNKELTIERVLDAPRDKVFKYWTDEALLAKWWGPAGVTNPICQWDARPGGKINIVMLAGKELGSMAGQEWPMTGEIKEVVRPEKIVFTGNAIMDGKVILENLCTVTFKEVDGQTKMTVRVVVTKTTPEATMALEGMAMGWNQQSDKLMAMVKEG